MVNPKKTENVVNHRPNAEELTEVGGFPPYWNPEEGKSFYASIVGIDARDPEFNRVVWRACEPIVCQTGPKDDAEEITVQRGEQFTTSLYGAFTSRLKESWAGIPVVVTCNGKKELKSGNEFWDFKMQMDRAGQALLLKREKEAAVLPAAS